MCNNEPSQIRYTISMGKNKTNRTDDWEGEGGDDIHQPMGKKF